MASADTGAGSPEQETGAQRYHFTSQHPLTALGTLLQTLWKVTREIRGKYAHLHHILVDGWQSSDEEMGFVVKSVVTGWWQPPLVVWLIRWRCLSSGSTRHQTCWPGHQGQCPTELGAGSTWAWVVGESLLNVPTSAFTLSICIKTLS